MSTLSRSSFFPLLLILVLTWTTPPASRAAEPARLVQIGVVDSNTAEFALAPRGFEAFAGDAFFVAGLSDPKRDWPYVHPGPDDAWAGHRPHEFTILFGATGGDTNGTARLILDLTDTHYRAPPRLRVGINGTTFDLATPAGASDEAIRGRPSAGRPYRAELAFPARLLADGTNLLTIRTESGSWILYDAVTLEAPAPWRVAPVPDFTQIVTAGCRPLPAADGVAPRDRLDVTVLHAGPPSDATWALDGTPLPGPRLGSGVTTASFDVPAVDRTVRAELAVGPVGREPARHAFSRVPGVREIVVVFKTHFDIGYTDMASNVVARYATSMIDQALEVADRNRDLPPAQQFAWTIPGWPMHRILDAPGQTAERRARVGAALREGRFVVHGLPFTTHTETLEPEDLVRSLGYSSRIARAYGLPLPRDGKMTDVPEHTRLLATILKHAGIGFMHIGCNGLSSPLGVPPLYWWEGPDGSRVLTMYSPNYGTGLLPPPDWPHRTWLALIHTGDNHGPPRPDEVKKILDEAARRRPGVRVRIGRLSDFADAILAEHPDLPVVRGDATDTWIHGPMSDPAGMRLARETRPRIAAVEQLNTALRAWDVAVPDAAPAIAAAWEQSLLYGEHTWGGSIGWLGRRFAFGPDFARERATGCYDRIEASWNEHTAYIEKARDIVAPELETNLQALARAVAVTGRRVVVFNPLPWKRSGLVSLSSAGFEGGLRDQATGTTAPCAKEADGSLRFLARDIPAGGYRTFVPADTAPKPPATAVDATSAARLERPAAGTEIRNEFLRLTLDPATGRVLSLVELRTGRELVDAKAEPAFGQFLYERFDQARVYAYCDDYTRAGYKRFCDFDKPGLPASEPYRAVTPCGARVRIESSRLAVAAIVESPAGAGVPCAVTMRYELPHGLPYLEIAITLHNKPLEPWPEAGWLCLPFKGEAMRFLLGRPGGLVDPATDLVAGGNRDLFTLNTGLALTGADGRGVGVCPLDHPMVSLERPGCWRYSTNFVPRKPAVFVNLFNNQWNTNFRLWNGGTWTSRVRVWGTENGAAESALITPSLEARNPLLAAVADGAAGSLPPERRGLEVTRRGVAVTAFGASPDGADLVLRLWELAGGGGDCGVRLPEGMAAASAQPIDLRGRPQGAASPVRRGSFKAEVPAFAPASFRLETPAAR